MSPSVTIWSKRDQRKRTLVRMNLAYQKAVKADNGEENERVITIKMTYQRTKTIFMTTTGVLQLIVSPGWSICLEGGSHTN